jgi:zinc/manganese transport system permease protein
LKDLLAGQILWVSMSQLLPVSILTLLILAVWFGFKDKMGRAGFYALFALAVTASVQLVGIYLVFSSLIIPALAVRNWPESRKILSAYLLGGLAYMLGLALSAVFDLPSGAVVVWCLALVGVAANVLNVQSKVRTS